MSNHWPPDWRDHDYYAIIGVPATATSEQITRAYRRLARSTHPDIDADHSDATERFRLLTDAHAVLTDPATRATYDRSRNPTATTAATSRPAVAPRPATPASSAGRPRPAGATVRPGPVIWTPPARPSRPGDPR
jgi:curved DNA-binding protein CbpA